MAELAAAIVSGTPTSRKDRGKRTYITARRMISGHFLNHLRELVRMMAAGYSAIYPAST